MFKDWLRVFPEWWFVPHWFLYVSSPSGRNPRHGLSLWEGGIFTTELGSYLIPSGGTSRQGATKTDLWEGKIPAATSGLPAGEIPQRNLSSRKKAEVNCINTSMLGHIRLEMYRDDSLTGAHPSYGGWDFCPPTRGNPTLGQTGCQKS